MSTITHDTVPAQDSFWSNIGDHLKNWGKKIVSAAKKAGGWFMSAAKWLWNSKPVQWVVGSPIGKAVMWAGGLVTSAIFAPKAVAVMVLATLVVIVIGAFFLWRGYRNLQKRYGQDAIDRFNRRVEDAYDEMVGIEFNDEPVANETIENRQVYLDRLLTNASANQDVGAVSELSARLFLLKVRWGQNNKLKADASVGVIHRECRREAEHEFPDFQWDFARMYRAARAEDKRLKEISRMQAKEKASV